MRTFSMLFSYIDPVSGVILLQLIIGGGIGCIARFRHKIWNFLTRRPMTAELKSEESIILSSPLQALGDLEPSEGMVSLNGASEIAGGIERQKDRIAA